MVFSVNLTEKSSQLCQQLPHFRKKFLNLFHFKNRENRRSFSPGGFVSL